MSFCLPRSKGIGQFFRCFGHTCKQEREGKIGWKSWHVRVVNENGPAFAIERTLIMSSWTTFTSRKVRTTTNSIYSQQQQQYQSWTIPGKLYFLLCIFLSLRRFHLQQLVFGFWFSLRLKFCRYWTGALYFKNNTAVNATYCKVRNVHKSLNRYVGSCANWLADIAF